MRLNFQLIKRCMGKETTKIIVILRQEIRRKVTSIIIRLPKEEVSKNQPFQEEIIWRMFCPCRLTPKKRSTEHL